MNEFDEYYDQDREREREERENLLAMSKWPNGWPCGSCQTELSACAQEDFISGFCCCGECNHRKVTP